MADDKETKIGQFIGYHIDGYDSDKTIPVATGPTYYEAQAKAIRRILSAGILDGQIGVQEKPELTADEFAEVTRITDEHAEKHGLVS